MAFKMTAEFRLKPSTTIGTNFVGVILKENQNLASRVARKRDQNQHCRVFSKKKTKSNFVG